MQNVAMFLRSVPNWEIVESLPDIGTLTLHWNDDDEDDDDDYVTSFDSSPIINLLHSLVYKYIYMQDYKDPFFNFHF